MPGVDNYAHAGGFAGGTLPPLDPLKPEQIDHMLFAVMCLGLSVLAIVASFVTASISPVRVVMRKPVVLITGASGEIGHGLIERLAADGSRES